MIYSRKILTFFSFQKILSFLAFLPFLLSFLYLWRLPIKDLGSVNFLDFLLFVFIIYSVVNIFIQKISSEFLFFCQKNSLLVLFSGSLVLFSLFNALESPFLWNSLGLWKSFFLLPIVFVWFLAFWKRKGFLEKSSLLNALWYSSCLLALGSFYFWLTDRVAYDGRLSFLFSSPNQLALTLSPALFIGLEKIKLFWQKQKHSLFFLTLLGFLLIVFSLWQTQSLGTLIFLPSAFFLGSFLFQKKSFLVYFLFLFLIFNFFLLFSGFFLLKSFSYQPNVPPNSTDSRIVIWQVTEEILKDHWLEGVGLGNFQNTYLAYQKNFPPFPQWAVPHSHNLFFTFWTELGLLNFVLFCFLLFLFFSSQKNTLTSKVLFLMLIYFLLYGLVEATAWKNDSALIFWFILFFGQINSEKSSSQTINKK